PPAAAHPPAHPPSPPRRPSALFSNSLPLALFVDAIVLGEAEGSAEWAIEALFDADSRASVLVELARHPHVFVPSVHGERLPELGDRKSTRLNSSHVKISYAVFC